MISSLTLSFLALVGASYARWIVPAARWYDTDGNRFNAHAGGICLDQHTETFYWFGEYKTSEHPEGGGISVYSSKDLATWKAHRLALGKAMITLHLVRYIIIFLIVFLLLLRLVLVVIIIPSLPVILESASHEWAADLILAVAPIEGHPWLSPTENRIQRPKVVYSEETGKYHMHWHADDNKYTKLLQGLATSDHIAGPYEFQHAIAPLGNWSQDFGLFTDYKDGRSYALYSNGDRVEGRDVYITRYNSNITLPEEVVYRFPKFDLEAPTIIQTEDSYYAIMSHKTGYRPNNVVAFRADSLAGPWSMPFLVALPYTRTFSTQSSFALRINGTKKTSYLYMGDTWDSLDHSESRNTWLPMEIDDRKGTLSIAWHDVFNLNIKTGEWKPIEGRSYWAKHARTTGNAYLQEAIFAGSGVMGTGIFGNTSKVVFEVDGAGKDQWVSFYHQNIDDMGFGDQPYGNPDHINGTWALRRISSVIVNDDESTVHTLYQKDTHKSIILSSPLLLPLKKGKNKITIGGLFNGKDYNGADIEKLVVYPPENA
ncbi:unnamed protein product [Clonostachys chloroleuca]|uniref:Uncharacterized protein n=1 Tax=Clonostachys chloroleuca TaxID=1926264 RepID=A0AA35PY53_9HYPO|nr:unnamed protein product [Clonostachys chloroleuca]